MAAGRPTGVWLLLVALSGAITLSPLACAGPEGTVAGGGFQPTVTIEGNVTTIVNGSGSLWVGSARLIEEASIGVETGAAEYMFGRPGGVYATGDRIYVIDTQVPTVRVFDFDGLHLFSFGQAGQGPGEFNDPYSIGGADGRIFVGDYGSRRINAYSNDGEFLADYPMGSVRCCVRQMVVTHDGVPWVQMREYSEADPVGENARMQGHDENGPFGELRGPPEIEFEPATIMFDGRESMVRFTPMMVKRYRIAPPDRQ
ncbi:MAG TPA: 6-bladed beta-propeller [Acidobacteriota bacterium]